MGPQSQRQPWLDHALDLAVQEATGQLIIVSPTGDHNWLWFRDGQVTGVSAPARRPLLAQRLVAFDVMTQQSVDKALTAARETPGTRLMDIILAEQAAPEAFLRDFLAATMSEQLAQIEEAGIRETSFRTGEARRISPLLVDLRDVIAGAHSGLHQIPADIADLAVSTQPGVTVAPGIEQSFVNVCDGHRRPGQLADQLGLTLNETMALLQQLLASEAVYLSDPRAIASPAPDEMLPPPFADSAATASPPASASAPPDLPPPTEIPAAPSVEPVSEEPVSAPYQPAQIPESPTKTTRASSATPGAPEAPAELHQMAAELAPELPEGADTPEHEKAPQHRITDETVDRQGVASMLAGLARPAADSPAPTPKAAPATPSAPPPQQRLTTSQAGTPAMRPDLLNELHSLGQEEPKPEKKTPLPPNGPPTRG